MILNSSQKAVFMFRKCFAKDVEEFWIAALSANLELIDKKLLFRGTVDQCSIHPRDVIRFVCEQNASAFIACHNHPSGNPKPSATDVQATKKIFQISRLIEIPMSDHLILGENQYYSFADRGALLKWGQVTVPMLSGPRRPTAKPQ